MNFRPTADFKCVILACLVAPALAHARPDPLDPTVPVPPLTHSSALSVSPTLSDTAVGSWRNANETVNRIGGWRVYGREAPRASDPASASTPPTKPVPAAPPSPHRHP
jgi:hypothetical protein